MPCLQDSHLALYAWQQLLSGGVVYFSQPPVDGFFLQYSSSLKPAAQERHSAVNALQQGNGLLPPPFWYFSQPCTPPKRSDGFFLQYSSSVKPAAQERHSAVNALQQGNGL